MRLSREAIKEFKLIYQREFKQTISDDEASATAERFMSLMEIILRPIPGIDCPLHQAKDNQTEKLPGSFDQSLTKG